MALAASANCVAKFGLDRAAGKEIEPSPLPQSKSKCIDVSTGLHPVSCASLSSQRNNANKGFLPNLRTLAAPALAVAIFAQTAAPIVNIPESWSALVAGVEISYVAFADESQTITPEDRARLLVESLRRKKEEAIARAEAEKKAEKEAEERRAEEEERERAKEQKQSFFFSAPPPKIEEPVVKDKGLAQKYEAAKVQAAPKFSGKSKTHGSLPLFVSQLGLLALYSGGIAAALFVPSKVWVDVQEKVEDVLETVLPAVDELWQKAQPSVQQAYETAAPAVNKAIEAATPVALSAMEKAKPVAEKLLSSAVENAQPFVQRASEKLEEVTGTVKEKLNETGKK